MPPDVTTFWPAAYQAFQQARTTDERMAILARVGSTLPPSRAASRWQWCVEALADEQARWFVLAVVNWAQRLPPCLLEPMMRVAIAETNVSLNGLWIAPCRQGAGRRATLEILVRAFEQGSDEERAGVRRLMYWFGYCGRRPWHKAVDDHLHEDLSALRKRLPPVDRGAPAPVAEAGPTDPET